MKNESLWTAGQLSDFVEGKLSPALPRDTPIKNFFVRAWSCRSGSFLVPLLLEGQKQSQMASVAVNKRKASGAIVENIQGLDETFPYILVSDLQSAALKLAQLSRESFKGKLVAVTGSAGKTTTTAMIANVLREFGSTWATLNNNNLSPHVTTNVMSLPEDNDYAVMELGLSLDYRVSTCARLARPHVAVITSIGKGHIEAFADEEDPARCVFQEKVSIMDYLSPGGVAVVPSNSEHFDAIIQHAKSLNNVERIITCGKRANDDVRLVSASSLNGFERVVLEICGKQISVDVPFIGEHMQINTLLAAGVIHALGLPLNAVRHISTTRPTETGLVRYSASYQGKAFNVINDSYNATDINVKAHCALAKSHIGRKLFILADIPRLAQHGEDIHAELIPHIDAAGFHHVITVGKNTQNMAKKLSTSSSSFANRFHAVNRLRELIENDDTVFIKGNHMSGFKDIMTLIGKFSDLEKM